MATSFVAGDTGSVLRVTCKDNATGAAINLTGATVELRWNAGGITTTRTMTVIDATNGVAEYQFTATDLVPGEMAFEVKITDSGGKILRNLNLLIENVRAGL